MNYPRFFAGLLFSGLTVSVLHANEPVVMTLNEIFVSAESGSLQLQPAIAAQAEAVRDISVARAALLPDINASLSLSYIGDGFTTKRNFSDYQKAAIPHLGNALTINIDQPVYTGGAVTASIELAGIKSTAARYAADLKRDNLRFTLTGFYLDLYRYHNLRGVVENNLAAARKVLADMHARFDQGTALRNDITRYELLVSDLGFELTRINNTIDIINTNLVTMAALPPGTKVIPDSTILALALPRETEQWWQHEASAKAPALAIARTGVDISQCAEKIVRSEYLPKVGLHAGWSLDGPILVEVPPINRNLSYWYVGVGVSYNLSSLFKSNKSMARSRAATIKAEDELLAAMENVELAVRADHVHYLEAYEELKTRTKGVELAESNYRVTATRYSEGMALITDMLDAANSRLDAERQLLDARINIIYYYHKLLFISGTI